MNDFEHPVFHSDDSKPEVEPEAVRAIESLSLPPKNRAELLLTLMGVKPVSQFDYTVRTWALGDTPPDHDDVELTTRLGSIYQSLDSVGLLHEQAYASRTVYVPRGLTKTEGVGVVIAVSKNKELLVRAVELLDFIRRDSPHTISEEEKRQMRFELGRLYGYPESAANQMRLPHIERTTVKPWLKQSDGVPDDVADFSFFAMSEQNIADEIAVAEQWIRQVRDLSPQIYQEVIESK